MLLGTDVILVSPKVSRSGVLAIHVELLRLLLVVCQVEAVLIGDLLSLTPYNLKTVVTSHNHLLVVILALLLSSHGVRVSMTDQHNALTRFNLGILIHLELRWLDTVDALAAIVAERRCRPLRHHVLLLEHQVGPVE